MERYLAEGRVVSGLSTAASVCYALPVERHWGYREGEVPEYGLCEHDCGQTLRIDRLDLIAEHEVTCTPMNSFLLKSLNRHEPFVPPAA